MLHPVNADVYSERIMSLVTYLEINGPVNLTVPVYVADFGSLIHNSPRFNLMLPPVDDDGYLCTFPKSVVPGAVEALGLLNRYSSPIGLLVKNGGNCSPQQKAQVALQIWNIIPSVKYLIIYGTDPKAANTPVILIPDIYPVPEKFESLGVFYVPYAPVQNIIAVMNVQRKVQGDIQYLLAPGSIYWYFQFTITNGKPSNEDSMVANNTPNFYWFRFVLFALLIAAPCIRAAYLWYGGGGRLHWRRNEQGRIVGIQYIPPIPFWLAAGRLPQPSDPLRDTLTEEEFANLPEIKYQPVEGAPEAVADVDPKEESNAKTEEPDLVVERTSDEREACPQRLVEKDLEKQLSGDDVDVSQESELVTQVSSKGESDSTVPLTALVPLKIRQPAHTSNSALPPSMAVPIEAPAPAPAESAPELINATTCTTCSICIDDFEAGETLILLPRCKHAFHKDCIQPWLLERQGCCPLCKANVLPDEQETDESCADDPPELDDATTEDSSRPPH
jgi:Ring finger domain